MSHPQQQEQQEQEQRLLLTGWLENAGGIHTKHNGICVRDASSSSSSNNNNNNNNNQITKSYIPTHSKGTFPSNFFPGD
jgi:hypothetical protein